MDQLKSYSSEDSNSPEMIDCAKNILINYEKLLFNDILSDYTIVVKSSENSEGRKINAHKTILYTQSKYFEALFDPNKKEFKENRQNQIEIVDIHLDVVEDMLRFMYTSKVLKMSTNAQDLLVAADRFDMPGLKQKCEKYLSSKLCTLNAAEMLGFAELHTANRLKNGAMDYIESHYNEVTQTDGWKQLKQNSNTAVFSDLYHKVMISPEKRFKK